MKRPRIVSAVAVAVALLVCTQLVYSQENAASPLERDVAEQATREELPAEDTLVFTTDGDTDTSAASGEIDAFGIWDLLRMVLALLMVIGAIYGVISLLRRRVKPSEVDDETSPIRVLASKAVGDQEIHAVMIGRQVLVLGGGSSGLDLITRVEDQETIDELVLAHSTASGTHRRERTFGSLLAGWLGNIAVPGTGGSESSAGSQRRVARDTGTDGKAKSQVDFSLFKGQYDRLRNLR